MPSNPRVRPSCTRPSHPRLCVTVTRSRTASSQASGDQTSSPQAPGVCTILLQAAGSRLQTSRKPHLASILQQIFTPKCVNPSCLQTNLDDKLAIPQMGRIPPLCQSQHRGIHFQCVKVRLFQNIFFSLSECILLI